MLACEPWCAPMMIRASSDPEAHLPGARSTSSPIAIFSFSTCSALLPQRTSHTSGSASWCLASPAVRLRCGLSVWPCGCLTSQRHMAAEQAARPAAAWLHSSAPACMLNMHHAAPASPGVCRRSLGRRQSASQSLARDRRCRCALPCLAARPTGHIRKWWTWRQSLRPRCPATASWHPAAT